MKQIHLKLEDAQVERTTQLAKELSLNRTAYIRCALDHYNEKIERELLSARFRHASAQCRDEILRVCGEFGLLDEEMP